MEKRDPDTAARPVVGLSERYAPGSVAAHRHRRGQLMYAVRGALTVFTRDGSWVLPPHRALWIPGGLEHGLKLGASIELRTLYIARKAMLGPSWHSCQVVEVPPLIRELILHIVTLRWNYPRKGPDSRLVEVLLERLSAVRQEPVYLPQLIDRHARAFGALMFANPAERRPLPALAKELGVGLRTLERAFNADAGMSVGAWVQQLRLVLALEMLAGGTRVGDAAFRVGYDNPSSFIAVFRRAFGRTPTAYFAGGNA
jgi:AraC-like DNA-binding protein